MTENGTRPQAAGSGRPRAAPRIPENADIAGALVSFARRLKCTIEAAEGPRGTVRVTRPGREPVLVPGRADPEARSRAVPRLAGLAVAAALGSHATPYACDTATRHLLHCLAPAPAPQPAAAALAPPGRLIADAVDQITAHCARTLAPIQSPRRPAPATPGRRREPVPSATPAPATAAQAEPRRQATRQDGHPEGNKPLEEHGSGELFARPMDAGADPEPLRRIWAVNEAAAAWYRTQLPESWASTYMTSERGFGPGVLDAFEVGYAPGGWTSLLDHLRSITGADGTRTYPDALIHAAGLASETRNGTLIDVFRDRVIFPVRDQDGRLAGFGGRKHPDDRDKNTPKYINTRATPAYDKKRILYGLWQSRRALEAGALPVLAEGYTDVLAVWCAAAGRYAPVASLGTAFTHDQATALAARGRLHDGAGVLVARDPDAAGMKAAEKDFSILVPRHTVDARFVPLDEDPADTWLRHGGPALRAVLDAHVPLADVFADTATDKAIADFANRAQGPGYSRRDLAQYETWEAAARALVPLRRYINIGRQAARVALATGSRYSDVRHRFDCTWYPFFQDLENDAYDRIWSGEEPQDNWHRWVPHLAPRAAERVLIEGPPAWEPGPEKLQELAAPANWHEHARAARTRTTAADCAAAPGPKQGRDPPPVPVRTAARRAAPRFPVPRSGTAAR